MAATTDIINSFQRAKEMGHHLSNQDALEILKSLRNIAQDRKIIDQLIEILATVTYQTKKIKKLSPRENQIFKLIALGLTSREIATLLTISLETVSTHRKNIIKKLEIKGAGLLYKYAYDYSQKA